MTEPVVIVAIGACTSVGRNAWSSAAATRAGVSGFGQHPYMIDAGGKPMRTAMAPWLDVDCTGIDRFEELLFPAMDEALEAVSLQPGKPLKMGLALALPSPRPGLPEDLQRQIIKRINARHARYFSATASFPKGHAAGLIGLQAATAKLERGAMDACVVAGVDSYIEPTTLEWLEDCEQLHNAGVQNNPWGLIPGEAGAALLLMREPIARAAGLPPLAIVLGTGTGMEPKRIKTETVCTGEGLTQAFRDALAPLPDGAKVTDVYGDMNGEPYRADEYGFTILRTGPRFDPDFVCQTPADCCGDVGAASGVLLLLLASSACVKKYSAGNTALIFCSSEDGMRGAAVVRGVQAER